MCHILIKDGVLKTDPAREMVTILDNNKVCCEELSDFNKFALDLIQPILDLMPNIDKERIHHGILRTTKINIGQVDHFDWEWTRIPSIIKVKNSHHIDDSCSVLIQLEGSSQICFSKSCLAYILQQNEGGKVKQRSRTKAHKKMYKAGYTYIHDLLHEYSPVMCEERELITLEAGDMLLFFGYLPHCGFAAWNLTNRRIHYYLPICKIPIPNNTVVCSPSLSSVKGNWFEADEPTSPTSSNSR